MGFSRTNRTYSYLGLIPNMLFEHCLITIALVVSFGFPLTLFLEFRNRWKLHLKLYPHITLFPILFLWVILLCFYQVVCDEKIIIGLIKIGTLSSAVAALALYVELRTNDFIMLFELSDKATLTISSDKLYELHDNLVKIKGIQIEDLSFSEKVEGLKEFFIDEIFNQEQIKKDESGKITSVILSKEVIYSCINYLVIFSKSINYRGIQEYNKKVEICQIWLKLLLTNYFWKNVPKAFSVSRLFYGFTFFFLANVMLNSLILLILPSSISLLSKLSFGVKHIPEAIQIKELHEFPFLVGIALVFIGFWLPLRLYYNLRIKKLMFDVGKLIGGNVEQFIYIGISMFMLSLVHQVWSISKDIKVIFVFSTIFITFSASVFSVYKSENNLVNLTFGLKSKSARWLIWLIICGLTLYILNFFPFRCMTSSLSN